MVIKMSKDKGGWIRVVEAFFSILLIGGVILIVANQNPDNNEDIALGIYDDEITILRTVQLDDGLRASVLSAGNLPVDMNSSSFPQNVKAKIIEKIPAYLTCSARICSIEQECIPSFSSTSDIYTDQVAIFANLQTNSPRKLAISCGVK